MDKSFGKDDDVGVFILVAEVGFNGRSPLMLETGIPGIFFSVYVRAGSTKQVAGATGEGATAALEIREYLKTV